MFGFGDFVLYYIRGGGNAEFCLCVFQAEGVHVKVKEVVDFHCLRRDRFVTSSLSYLSTITFRSPVLQVVIANYRTSCTLLSVGLTNTLH